MKAKNNTTWRTSLVLLFLVCNISLFTDKVLPQSGINSTPNLNPPGSIVYSISDQAKGRDEGISSTSAPKHEFRSSWLTTLSGLDWPKSTNTATQQSDMIAILDQLKSQNMNAIVFQVSPRGDAYYQSERLPWATNLTGTTGQDPGWDPLQFVIDEARERGLEVHAWYNPFIVAYNSINDHSGAGVQNVRFTNPDWMEDDGWMNPGIPAAREWQVANVMELIENYDIDAIHFDRIRYDSGGYDRDSSLMSQYNPDGIQGLDNWRRHNVNEFVREVHEEAELIRPEMKIGVTPMGHHDHGSSDGWGAMYAYSDVFQDSRYWAEQGYVDYIAPQIYWDIGGEDPPYFPYIVNDWVENRKNNRHLYIGIAAWKANVFAELENQIDEVRDKGAEGQLYFRNDIIASSNFSGRYNHPALVPPMSWRDMNEPDSVRNLSVEVSGQNFVLTWDEPLSGPGTPEAVRYVIYRADAVNIGNHQAILDNPENIIEITGVRSLEDGFEGDLELVERTYYVTSVSRNNVESEFQKLLIGEPQPDPNMINEIPWDEDFSGTTHDGPFPAGWETIGSGISMSSWSDRIPGINIRYSNPVADPIAITPEIHSDIDIATLELTFDAHYATNGDANDQVHVGFMSDPADAGTFTLIETVTLTRDAQTFTIALDGHEAVNGRRIGFMADRGGSWNSHYLGLIELNYLPYGTISGFIYEDGNTANRVSGALVSLHTGQNVTTGAQGTYEFDDLLPGSYTITVSKEGYDDSVESAEVVSNEETVKNIELFSEYIPEIGEFVSLWDKSAGDYAWMGTGSTERGMAYHGGKLYVASRGSGNAVRIIDAADGDDIGSLDASFASGGALAISGISTSDDGAIFVANLTTNASTSSFKVYMWEDDEDDAPQTVVNWTAPSAMRLVDNLTVSGSIGDGSAVIYAAVGTNAEMYRWVMEDDGAGGYQFESNPEHFSLPNISSWGTPSWIAPKGSGPDAGFIAGGRSADHARSYTWQDTNTGFINNPGGTGTSAANYQTYDEDEFLFFYRATDRKAYLNELAASGTSGTNRTGTTLGETGTMGGTTEATHGDIAVANYGDGTMQVYVLATNNGIWAYEVKVGEPPGPIIPDDIVWWKSLQGENLPEWFGSNTERGLAIVEEGENTYVLIQSAATNNSEVYIHIIDAETGNELGTMNLSSYSSGGTFHLSDVAVSEDNKIFLANYSQSEAIPFKVFMFENTNDINPEVVINNTPAQLGSNWHLSRNIFVTGSYTNGTATLLANNDNELNSFLVARYTQTGPGEAFGEPEIINLGGSGGNPASSVSRPGRNAPIYHTTSGGSIHKHDGSETHLFTIDNFGEGLHSVGLGRLHFLGTTANGDDYFGVFKHDEREAWLVKVPPGGEDRGEFSEVVAKTPALGTASTLGLGDIRFIQDDNGFDVYYLAANNGIGRARIDYPVVFEAEEDIYVGGAGEGWRMFSMPVGGVRIEHLSEQYFVQGFEPELHPRYSPNILFVDAENQVWSSKGRDQYYEFQPGEGFIWFFYDGETGGYANDYELPVWLRFDGSSPSSNVTANTLYAGKNLIGNPFHRDLDVTAESGIDKWGNNDLSSAIVQVWDNSGDEEEVESEREGDYPHSGSWLQIGGGDGNIVSPWQGFVVENLEATGIDFPIAAAPRFRGRETPFHKPEEYGKNKPCRLSFNLWNQKTDTTRALADRGTSIFFHPDATDEWDRYDATKLTPFSGSFATLAFEGEHLGQPVLKVQESRPLDFEGSFEVPLSFDTYDMSGTFVIEWMGMEDLPDEWVVMLRDRHAGSIVDLRKQSSYIFTANDVEKYALAKTPGKGKMAIPALASLELGGLSKSLPGGARFSLFVASDPIYGEILADLPKKVELLQNYPNPFNPVTVLPYALPEESHVRLTIYDVLGRQVAVLVDGVKEAGRYEVSWDATRQASGVYIYRLEAGGEAFTRKMTLVK